LLYKLAVVGFDNFDDLSYDGLFLAVIGFVCLAENY